MDCIAAAKVIQGLLLDVKEEEHKNCGCCWPLSQGSNFSDVACCLVKFVPCSYLSLLLDYDDACILDAVAQAGGHNTSKKKQITKNMSRTSWPSFLFFD